MDLTGKNKNIAIAVGIIAVSLLVTGTIFAINGDFGFKKGLDDKGLKDSGTEERFLQRDPGLNVDVDWEGDKTKQVFFRYRFIDTDSGGNVDISNSNAQLFITDPSGMKKEIISEFHYYPFRMVPSPQEGTYTLEAILNNGKVYSGNIYIPKKEEFNTVLIDKQKIVEEETLKAFKVEGVDLSRAKTVYHILPNGAGYWISEIPGRVDEYIWSREEDLQNGEHIFLVETDNAWYYNIGIYPENF